MESSAKASASGRDSDSERAAYVMNVNRPDFGGKPRTLVGDTTPSILVVVALGIGYLMGSMSTSTPGLSLVSIGKSAWEVTTVLEEWVREVIVRIYTLSVLLYLSVRVYVVWKDGTISSSSNAKTLAAFRSTVSSSLSSLPPVLRRLSTLTTVEEGAESSADSPTKNLFESGLSEHQIEQDEAPQGDKPIDMTGTFKVVENDNFGDFLNAQGVPWFLCNAASKARPTHNFSHTSPTKLTIQIRGIIESETSYNIGGPYTETTIRGRVFQDTLSYLYEETSGTENTEESKSDLSEKICVGVQTRKIAMGEGYQVHVERRIIRAGTTWVPTPEMNPDGHCTYDLDKPCDFDRLHMANKVIYDKDDGKKPVIASQLFHRTD